MIRQRVASILALSAALTLSACGGDDTTSTGSADGGSSTSSDSNTSDSGSSDSNTESGTMSNTGGDGDSSTGGDGDSNSGGDGDTNTGGDGDSNTGGDGDTNTGGDGDSNTGGDGDGGDGDGGTGGDGDAGGDGDGDGDAPCTADVDCDDAIFCNGTETCDTGSGVCQAGTAVVCADDGVACTADFCSEAEQGCVNVPQDALCSDDNVCDGIETCDATLGCQEAPAGLDCNDGVSCTVDSCDAVDGCVNAPDDSICDNGTFCDGAETCDAVNDCQAALAPIDCNDGVLCTIDACDEDNDQCVNTADDGVCDNGSACDGVETCNQMLDCQAGSVVTCDDGIACTDDLCVEDAGAQDGYTCNNTADNSECPSDQYCCTDCDPTGCAQIPECETDADCDDNNDCNGVETCVDLGGLNGKVCEFGTPVVCDDGVSCTTDSCDPADGQCDFTPVDAACDNGLFCDGAETCHPTNGCEAGTAPTCSDGITCTNDACIEGFGCYNEPDNSQCSDGLACNGDEVCSINDGGCVAGTALDCDDGFDCTVDSCDDTVGCKNLPDNTLCPCGEVCDTTADPVDGCSNNCVVQTCEGQTYFCGDCIDNDGDCLIDAGVDPECFGPCDNNEEGYKGLISGQNDNCNVDCYFDNDNGGGNDNCEWSWACDPLEPQNPPETSCTYEDVDPADGWGDENIPPGQTCQELFETQSTQCWNPDLTDVDNNVCGKYVPNGCDCFGCCAVQRDPCTTSADCPGTGGVCDQVTNQCVYTVYLGSQNGGNPNDPGSCNYDELQNPANCHPCTQVQACLNECEAENCELCFGQTELPPECTEQECPDGVQLCGQAGQDACPTGASCITGCCIFG